MGAEPARAAADRTPGGGAAAGPAAESHCTNPDPASVELPPDYAPAFVWEGEQHHSWALSGIERGSRSACPALSTAKGTDVCMHHCHAAALLARQVPPASLPGTIAARRTAAQGFQNFTCVMKQGWLYVGAWSNFTDAETGEHAGAAASEPGDPLAP